MASLSASIPFEISIASGVRTNFFSLASSGYALPDNEPLFLHEVQYLGGRGSGDIELSLQIFLVDWLRRLLPNIINNPAVRTRKTAKSRLLYLAVNQSFDLIIQCPYLDSDISFCSHYNPCSYIILQLSCRPARRAYITGCSSGILYSAVYCGSARRAYVTGCPLGIVLSSTVLPATV